MLHSARLRLFNETYARHVDPLFRHCCLRLLDRETALDIIQEAFVRLWKTMEREGTIQNTRAYLYRIAHNLIVDAIRRRQRRPTVSLETLRERGRDIGYDPSLSREQSRQWKDMVAVLGKLPPSERALLVLRYREGFTPREIATITGRTAAVVSVQLHRATKRLRFLLRHG